jgi:protein ImuA
MASIPDTTDLLATLRENIRRIEGVRPPGSARAPLSSGCPPLDRLLPEAGFPPGALVEWLSDGEGGGAETLAMLTAREALVRGGVLAVLDRRARFYPPAAAALGIDLQQTFVVRARHPRDELWALDQVLRCPGVAVACAAIEPLDWRWFRRLQLAVEEGGGWGLLLRPARVRGQPSWSRIQLLVQPRPSSGSRRLRVELTRCCGSHSHGKRVQGGARGKTVELEIDDWTGAVCARHETRTLHLAAQLAHPTPRRRSARA